METNIEKVILNNFQIKVQKISQRSIFGIFLVYSRNIHTVHVYVEELLNPNELSSPRNKGSYVSFMIPINSSSAVAQHLNNHYQI